VGLPLVIAWSSGLAGAWFVGAAPAVAQDATVAEVRVEREGRPVTDPTLLALIETKVGEAPSPRLVRETIAHLMGLGTYEDVQVLEGTTPTGRLTLRYVLVPAHPVDRVAFEGTLGAPEDDLRRIVTDQLGVGPRATQHEAATQALRRALRDRGYPEPSIEQRLVETHDPEGATLRFTIDAGRRAVVTDVRITHADGDNGVPLLERPVVRTGEAYQKAAIDRALQRWEERLRARGYYEARASHGVLTPSDGAVVSITLTQGPLIRVAFAGDPLSAADRTRLVPIQAEASADEDLLEDSARAVEAFLRQDGYRDARVDYARVAVGNEVTVTFTARRGPQYVVGDVRTNDGLTVTLLDIRSWLGLSEGQLYAEDVLARGVSAVVGGYRERGYARVRVQAKPEVVEPERPADRRRVHVRLEVEEGPRILVRDVAFEGHTVLDAATLRALAALDAGRPYTEADVAAARDRIDLEYRNRGYDGIVVTSATTLTDSDTRAVVRFSLVEGPQVIVDRVLIVGTVRTSPDTIRRELLIRPGDPLGYTALLESRNRLAALAIGRMTIEEIAHGSEPRRDLLVRVEEAPPWTMAYGAGVEGAFRLRTNEAGQAVERVELVPRGSFQIGRRNLFGKNRTANLFTRVSLRNRGVGIAPGGLPATESDTPSYGFNEYRIVGTFREPRVFGLSSEVLVTGILEQAIRSSFNFARRELRAEAGVRASRVYSLTGRYSFERTELFDERFTDGDGTLIDRLFPQVRFSTFSGALVRDSRDDPVDSTTGSLFTVTGDLAARAVGSEVGFTKTYVEAFSFHRLPTARRTVVALAARVGAAHGFAREVAQVGTDGQPVLGSDGRPVITVVEDIPASKRFFAGGDTTVRGFSLDRLGDASTISPSGFPTGGNGVIVLNGEMRVGVTGPLQVVGFMDAGNVVSRAADLSLTDLRTAAGFGIRYRSPVGPIRLDLGFKLDRRELSPGRLERRSVWHISFGQAF
jgi:outer membrane protein assembly factor BamA